MTRTDEATLMATGSETEGDVAAGYRTIVIDPPWDYGATNKRSSAGKHYPTMRNEEIAALPIAGAAAPSAHLYLWVTNPRLFGARNGRGPAPLAMLEGWGFRYITMLTWHKTGAPGMGFYFRGDTEHVLFGIRGAAPIPPALRRSNHFTAPRGRHSAKPDVFYDRARIVSQGPYLEVFGRAPRDGWTVVGNEIDGRDVQTALPCLMGEAA